MTTAGSFSGNGFFSKIVRFFLVAMLPAFLLASCSNEEKAPDVSKIEVMIRTRHLEQDLSALDTNRLAEGLQRLQPKYPDFLNFYLDTIMGFNIQGQYVDTLMGIRQGLKTFLTYKDYRGLFDTVARHYPDTKSVDEDLAKSFKYMKYYYPTFVVPDVIYFVSGLNNYGAFTFQNSTVGIGLDMFLGDQYPFYKSVGLPDYMYKQLRPAYIPVAVMRSIYQGMRPFIADNRSLLDMMIQRGKEQYFLSKVLPFTEDTLRLAYTTKQLEWCGANEAMVYNFFIQHNMLYETSMQQIFRYVNDGPNAAGMPAESPGNIGSWMGLQIVKAYIKEHPQTTLPQLLQLDMDAQRFLQESKYKPK